MVDNSFWHAKKRNTLTVCEEHVCPSIYGITGVSEVIDESLNWLLITQTYLFIYNTNSTIQKFWIGKIVKMFLKSNLLTTYGKPFWLLFLQRIFILKNKKKSLFKMLILDINNYIFDIKN